MSAQSTYPAAAISPAGGVNIALAAGHVAANAYQFLVLPLVLLPLSPWYLLTAIPVFFLNNPLWSLIHETIHGVFYSEQRINRAAGRILAISYCAPWRMVAVGHLLHHKFNRTPLNRLDAFDPAKKSGARARLRYYYKLFAGLYLQQLLSPVFFYLPRRLLEKGRDTVLTKGTYSWHAASALIRPGPLREMRTDMAFVYILLGASVWAYGAFWWMVPAIILGRAFCISFLDYIYHYDTPTDDVWHGHNLRLPGLMALLLLNFNLHGVHHRNQRLPWHALPAAFRAQNGQYEGGYFSVAARQLRGPLAEDRLELAANAARAAG